MQHFSTATRTVKTRKPGFALGIDGGTVLLRSWTECGVCFDLLEDPAAVERDGGYPYRLHWTEGGVPQSQGFDSADDAELWAKTLTTPCPVEFAPVVPAPVVHTPSDELWWSQTTATPIMPICGGSPEPDAELGYSGAWYMPGEDEDLEPVVRDLSDDWTGDFGHQA